MSCVLQLRNQGYYVSLLTNDVNLRNKAVVSNITPYQPEDLEKLFNENYKKEEKGLTSSRSYSCIIDDRLSNDDWKVNSYSSDDEMMWTCSDYDSKNSLPSLPEIMTIAEIKEYISIYLGKVLKNVMQSIYGDLWTSIIIHKPPWTALRVLQCIDKHWIAVFMDKFNESFHSTTLSLLKQLKSNTLEASTIRNHLNHLFIQVNDTHEYKELVQKLNFDKNKKPMIDSKERLACMNISNAIYDIGHYSNEMK